MEIRAKYNHDPAFRRRAAFWRMYRARNFKRRFLYEMALFAVSAAVAAVIWFTGGGSERLLYVFYAAGLIAVYLLVRLLRSVVVAWRVRPLDAARAAREFLFHDAGFRFGPVDEAGSMLETRWRDIDRVYFTEEAIYILCMARRHWAVVDKAMILEGTAEELEALIRSSIPKRLTTG
jgi:hypothetical protein